MYVIARKSMIMYRSALQITKFLSPQLKCILSYMQG